jgi:putative glutamine amidotransferase
MSGSGSDVDGGSTPAGAQARPVIAVAWPKPDYLESLVRAGAEPRVLTSARDALPAALEGCDGLLLTGGDDVDPALYHARDRHPTVTIDRARDDYEIGLTRAALDRGLPILAICRGVQVLNVAAGGTLVQDLPSEQPAALPHKPGGAPDTVAHDVIVTPNTMLERLLGGALDASRRVAVNSRHHQSVKDVAPGFHVTAVAPDGVVEAVEKPDARFCVGVQWHPENFWRTGTFATLFRGFVDAARR